MRNFKLRIIVIGMSLCVSAFGYAQQQAEDMTSLEKSSLDMAKLNQQVEFAKRELIARGLQQDLANIRLQQEQRSLGFNVASIQGFDQDLFAMIIGENGGVFRVEPGGVIGENYQVSRMTPSEVQVVDRQTQQVYTVPFLKLKLNSKSKSGSVSINENKVTAVGAGSGAPTMTQSGSVSATTNT